METVNIHEAKTHLSRLVERAENGEEIVIARAGRPAAKLVPYEERKEARELGAWRGKVWLAPDWDADEVNEEIASLFDGSQGRAPDAES